MSDCICPYCNREIDEPDDCWEPDQIYEYECPYCGKNFIFEVAYDRVYFESKAACLNGGNHEYKMTGTYPVEMRRLKCAICRDEKPL